MLKQDNNVVMALFGGKPVKRPLLVTFRIDERLGSVRRIRRKQKYRPFQANQQYIKKCLELEKD
jgi:hypothetical protein